MAHVGNPYPVIDRRDVNLNVNRYAEGWARRYLCDIRNLPAGIGKVVENFRWDCGPGGVTDAGLIFWQSQPELVGALAFDIILEASIVNGSTYIKGFRIREAVTGDIGIFRCSKDPTPYGTGFPFFNTWPSTFIDPDYFSSAAGLSYINAFPKSWEDPPPH